MHLNEIYESGDEEMIKSLPQKLSVEAEKNVVELGIDRYLKLHPYKIQTPDWPYKIEKVNSVSFQELKQWNSLWIFTIKSNVTQSDNAGSGVSMITDVEIYGNVEMTWDIKTNPIHPTERDWFTEVEGIHITNIKFETKTQ